MANNRVLMVGTDTSTMGGIASVIIDYIESGIFERLSISYHSTHRDGGRVGKALFFLKQMLLFVIRANAYRIIHIHTSHGWSYRRLFVILLISLLFRKRTVLHVHGSQFDLYYQNAASFEKGLIRFGLLRADRVVALSDQWRDRLLAIQPDARVEIIMNTVNTDKYRFDDRPVHTPVSVLFLGRLGERKGVYDILKAFRSLDMSGYRFVLAGDGDIEAVRAEVSRNGWQNSVAVPGWISGDSKLRLLAEADIYILPSYNEGLPIGLLEAISSGLAVIATDVGGIPNAVDNGVNGYLIKPTDWQALVVHLQALASDHSRLACFGRASRELALKKFSMPRAEEQLRELYSEIL